MLSKNIETFIACDHDYEPSSIVLFGAPFDGTTSFRPGTRFASKAIRSESFGIETYSPYQDRDLLDLVIFDAGDLEFPFGRPEKVLDQIQGTTAKILSHGKCPVMIGGEHLVTLGAMRAIIAQYPDVHIIHLDAHADLRDDYLGESLSHATVMRRIWDLVGDGRIYQFGIRSGDRQEFIFAQDHTIMQKFTLDGLDQVVTQLQGKPVYLTLDLDVLDPSIFPGTGTPEAGGIDFNTLLSALLALAPLQIIGCDINELSPVYDGSGVSTAVACKILREILLILGGNELWEKH